MKRLLILPILFLTNCAAVVNVELYNADGKCRLIDKKTVNKDQVVTLYACRENREGLVIVEVTRK